MQPVTLTGQSILVDEILRRDHDTTLEEYLTEARSDELSYNAIAHLLSNKLNLDGFTVTYQWVRRWCRRFEIDTDDETA